MAEALAAMQREGLSSVVATERCQLLSLGGRQLSKVVEGYARALHVVEFEARLSNLENYKKT